MSKKKLTKNQVLFQKQISRIDKAIRRAEKRGYVFYDYKTPEMPKRVTQKALNELANIKGYELYKKGYKVDENTGELLSGLEARKRERQVVAQKAAETRRKNKEKKKKKLVIEKENVDYEIEVQHKPKVNNDPINVDYDTYPSFTSIVIANFKAELSYYPVSSIPILKWFNEMVRLYGEDDVAEMLESAKQDGIWIDASIRYNKEKTTARIAQFMNYLPEMSVGIKEELLDAFEIEEDWETPQ